MAKFKKGDACYYGSTPCVYIEASNGYVWVAMGGTGSTYADEEYLLKLAKVVTERHKEIAEQYNHGANREVARLLQLVKDAKNRVLKL